jgi:hypothetical protein
MNNFELTGELISRMDTKQISEKFRVREFVLKIVDGDYTEEIKFQGVNDVCDYLDQYEQGMTVTASFSIKGRRYQKPGKDVTWFNNLNCWKIAGNTKSSSAPHQETPLLPVDSDDLPF